MMQASLLKSQDVDVFRRAVEMASSGEFSDWSSIQANLVENGFRRAPYLLDTATIRAVLDARCQSTRRLERTR